MAAPAPDLKGDARDPVAWRQSLGAGLLLGLALGCSWLAHWTALLYTRLLLIGMAGLLALLGLGLMFALTESRRSTGVWRRRLEAPLAAIGLPFFAILLVLGLAAITSGNNLLYLIVSGLLGALVVSALTSGLNLSGMELNFRLPPELYAGRPTPVGFTLCNAKKHWPAYSLTLGAGSRAAEPVAEGPEMHMQPVYLAYLGRKASVQAESEMHFPRRGRYAGASFVVSTRFPFGLLDQKRQFHGGRDEPEVVVYPAPLDPPSAALAALRGAGRASRARRGEGQDLYLLRPHQPGDSARHVHWKATARAGELRVREFHAEDSTQVRLRLALPPGLGAEAAEAAISLCAGWMLQLDRPDLWLEFVGVNAPGLYLPMAPAVQQRRAVLDYLAVVRPAELTTLPPLAAEAGPYEIAITG